MSTPDHSLDSAADYGHGAEDERYDDPQTAVRQGFPLRGLAMVLIAVAALLALWGIYSMSKGEAENPAMNPTASQASSPAPAASAPAHPGQPQTGAPAAPAMSSPAAAPAAPSSPANAPVDPAAGGDLKVHVLNNSTQQGLAARVADQVGHLPHYHPGEVGNLADVILDHNTVFFTPGDPAIEARAKDLAARVGGEAKPRIPELPADTAGAKDLVIVLVDDVRL